MLFVFVFVVMWFVVVFVCVCVVAWVHLCCVIGCVLFCCFDRGLLLFVNCVGVVWVSVCFLVP